MPYRTPGMVEKEERESWWYKRYIWTLPGIILFIISLPLVLLTPICPLICNKGSMIVVLSHMPISIILVLLLTKAGYFFTTLLSLYAVHIVFFIICISINNRRSWHPLVRFAKAYMQEI